MSDSENSKPHVVKVTKEQLQTVFGHYCGNPNCVTCRKVGNVPRPKVAERKCQL